MKEGEISEINNRYPFMKSLLRRILQGDKVQQGDPFYDTYLMARQRGFVKRTGEDMKTIVVSERGEEFLDRSK